jgi:toxin-antitoxin system PIN domain toxin
MKIIDVNILLYAVNPHAPEHGRIRLWWEAAIDSGEPLGFAWIVIVGFLRLATHPRVFPHPLTVSEALGQIQEWLDLPAAAIVQEPEDYWPILSDLVTTVGTAGNLTTDAHLAALAIAHRATLASCDADFLRFRQVRWENPLAASPAS